MFLDRSTVRRLIVEGALRWPGEMRCDSLLLKLGDRLQPMAENAPEVVDLAEQKQIDMMYGPAVTGWDAYTLRRGCLALFHTECPVALPRSVGGLIGGLSHMARLGLTVHLDTPIVDAGFSGTLTMEMFNAGPSDVVLRPGMPVAKVILYRVGETSGKGSFVHPYYGKETDLGSKYAEEFFTSGTLEEAE